MMKKSVYYTYILFMLCALCLVNGHLANAQAASVEIEPFGMAELDTFLEKNAGKVIMINFFASWCPPCKEEVPDLIALNEHFSKDDVVFIGVSLDEDPLALTAFMDLMKIKYPVYLAKANIQQYFEVNAIPHNVVYDTKGKIAVNVAGMAPKSIIQKTIESLLKGASS